ncbi:alkyl hydroperoxide reductase subunit C [Nocardioides litoris]|uniref:alkyl hydroperoxide reductase subunit C n=1 Tax=Nocardioides litoris TaxID=1926648 RepID=UPI001123E312|nr:alkyl hydroperoxide reductase subunit C [Nocardioides litoris]
MPQISSTIAPFELNAYRNGEFIRVSDHDFAGRWNVVMFYPGDFTFVCPTELEDLANHHDEFEQLGVRLYSASTDSHFAHKAWHDSSSAVGKVQYTMLADPTHEFTRAFDVLVEQTGQALRGTFVIDPNGVIRVVEVHDDGVGRNAAELLRKVKAAQYIAAHPGEVCPANWDEGGETLAPTFDLVGKI